MPKRKNGDPSFKYRILRTLIEEGGPVTFKNVREKASKPDTERQLVYYYLEKLVEEGQVFVEEGPSGERIYQCREYFYREGLLRRSKEVLDTLALAMGLDVYPGTDINSTVVAALLASKA